MLGDQDLESLCDFWQREQQTYDVQVEVEVDPCYSQPVALETRIMAGMLEVAVKS